MGVEHLGSLIGVESPATVSKGGHVIAQVAIDSESALVAAPDVHTAHVREQPLPEGVEPVGAEQTVGDHPSVKAEASGDASV